MIKPDWAFSVWANSDNLFAELPAVNGHQSHIVRVPNTVVGLKKLLILASSRNHDSTVGTKGDPCQSQIEKISYDPSMVRRPKEKSTPEQIAGARQILRRLGLI
jgi:hypothetical protein